MRRERRSLDMRRIEDETAPLGLITHESDGLKEGLILSDTRPSCDRDKALALLEIGNRRSHCLILQLFDNSITDSLLPFRKTPPTLKTHTLKDRHED